MRRTRCQIQSRTTANWLTIKNDIFLRYSVSFNETSISSLYICISVLLAWLPRWLPIPRIIITVQNKNYCVSNRMWNQNGLRTVKLILHWQHHDLRLRGSILVSATITAIIWKTHTYHKQKQRFKNKLCTYLRDLVEICQYQQTIAAVFQSNSWSILRIRSNK